jgi:hypothetical protein
MINEKEFIDRIKRLPKTIPSKTKTAFYTAFKLEGETLFFKRVVPETFWDVNIKQLYKIYSTNNFINTSVIKKITKGRVNSPSVAILMFIRCIDEIGNRI